MNPLFGMLGIDVEDFKAQMNKFLEFVQQTLAAIDRNIQDVQQRQERIETKLDQLLGKTDE